MKTIDYTLYLVTGRNLLPPGIDYGESLEEALKGGVTIVQVREKDVDTQEFIQIARLSKRICDKYNIPLIVNDRVDVALAIDADGVHLGQTDMSIEEARKLLPPGKLIGVSCNTLEHVQRAVRDRVDYVGLGAIWGTQTKKLTSPVVGVHGVGAMLEPLDGTNVKAVAIGGIKSTNLLRTLHGGVSVTHHPLDGVAVVSDIVASLTPRLSAKRLQTILLQFRDSFSLIPSGLPDTLTPRSSDALTPKSIVDGVTRLMGKIRSLNPLVHQITNTVVATQSANLTLALGASPIMATEPLEMEDLARICGALLVNIGTMREEQLKSMVLAGVSANSFRKPVVFDPVGIGATTFRKGAVRNVLNAWQASVIKGNAGELAALAGTTEVESRGVDSLGAGFKNPAKFVRDLARRQRCVVVLTGPTDYISDGKNVISIDNGDPVLGQITGSGCMLGSCIASYCAVASQLNTEHKFSEGSMLRGDMFLAAISGVLVLTVASELTMERPDVKGPGTFLPALIDTLWTLAEEKVEERAKISVLNIE